MRPIKPRNCAKNLGLDDYAHAQVVQYATMKYSLRKGFKNFKNIGEVKVEKKLNQLHNKSTDTPKNTSDMSDQQKEDTL